MFPNLVKSSVLEKKYIKNHRNEHKFLEKFELESEYIGMKSKRQKKFKEYSQWELKIVAHVYL